MTPTGYLYTAPDGTRVTYSSAGPERGYPWVGPGCALGDPGTCALPTAVTRPNGMVFTLAWDILERCHQYDAELTCVSPAAYFRFDGVTSSAGYGFGFDYLTDNPSNQGAPQSNWYKRTGATFTNAVTPPPVAPAVSYAAVAGAELVTDTGGRTWRIAHAGGLITGLRLPGAPDQAARAPRGRSLDPARAAAASASRGRARRKPWPSRQPSSRSKASCSSVSICSATQGRPSEAHRSSTPFSSRRLRSESPTLAISEPSSLMPSKRISRR